MAFDELFEPPAVVLPAVVQRWSKWRAEKKDLVCRFERPRVGLSFAPAKLRVFPKGHARAGKPVLWEGEYERWLLKNKVKAETLANESERVGFDLRELMAPKDIHFGTGLINSALLPYLLGEGLVPDAERQALEQIKVPKLRSQLKHELEKHIAEALSSCASSFIELGTAVPRQRRCFSRP